MQPIRAGVALFVLLFISGCAGFGIHEFHFVEGQKTELHPILQNRSWISAGAEVNHFDDQGFNILWHRVTYYRHPTEPWNMASHVFFGQEVLRAYGIRKEGKLEGHWIALKNGRKWYLVKSERVVFKWVRTDEAGRGITGVQINVYDEHNRHIILSRIVKR